MWRCCGVVVELLVLSVWGYVVSYCVWELLVSGAFGLGCFWSLVLKGLWSWLVSGTVALWRFWSLAIIGLWSFLAWGVV